MLLAILLQIQEVRADIFWSEVPAICLNDPSGTTTTEVTLIGKNQATPQIFTIDKPPKKPNYNFYLAFAYLASNGQEALGIASKWETIPLKSIERNG